MAGHDHPCASWVADALAYDLHEYGWLPVEVVSPANGRCLGHGGGFSCLAFGEHSSDLSATTVANGN